jgi:hypothetical protein
MHRQALIIQQLRTFDLCVHFAVSPTIQRIPLKRLFVDLGTALGMALAFAMPAWSQNNNTRRRGGHVK